MWIFHLRYDFNVSIKKIVQIVNDIFGVFFGKSIFEEKFIIKMGTILRIIPKMV
jgi:hypothetical protein